MNCSSHQANAKDPPAGRLGMAGGGGFSWGPASSRAQKLEGSGAVAHISTNPPQETGFERVPQKRSKRNPAEQREEAFSSGVRPAPRRGLSVRRTGESAQLPGRAFYGARTQAERSEFRMRLRRPCESEWLGRVGKVGTEQGAFGSPAGWARARPAAAAAPRGSLSTCPWPQR